MSRPWMPAVFRTVFPIALLLIACMPVCAVDDEPASASDTQPKPIKVTGTFEAIRNHEVTAGNDHLTELKIQRVLPFGAKIAKGQALIWFETDKLDDRINDAETDLKLARLALQADELSHQQFLKQQALDKAKAKRTRDSAQQSFDNYQKIDRERTIKQAKFSLKSSEFSLESATEEFRQLLQMYKEDDLTEESEEIVLRRAKHSMESAAFSLERTKIQTERTIKQSIPRSDASQQDTLARAMINYDTSTRSMANDRQKRELELDRKKSKFKKQSKTFAEMRAERQQVVLKSPIDGIFLYGQLTRGKLPAKPVSLKQGGSAAANQVLATVVDPSRLQVRVDLPEERFSVITKGVKCKVIPKGMPNVQFEGVVKSVSAVPFTNGKFDCIVSVRGKQLADVMPAMSCELLFVNPDAEKSEPSKEDSK